MTNNIAIVIPTFNQKEIILKTISLLKEQTVIPDIIVVDNNSDDDTAGEINKIHPDVIVLIAKDNFGSSGGQYIGARYAYEKGYDRIILSDNDAYPVNENLIEELVRNASHEKVTQPLNEYQKDYKGTLFALHYACYSREIFKKVGFPLFDFFLFGDDEEFSRRIEKAGFKINKLEHVFYNHPMKRTFAPARFYFLFRNCLNIRRFYDKRVSFLFRSLVVLSSLIAYKIMGEKDCYYFGMKGLRHFLSGNYDNSFVKKTSKYFSPLISSGIEAFQKENAGAFVNISKTTNSFLNIMSLRGKVNNAKNFLKLAKSKEMITETINGYEAILCSFIFNSSLIAIDNIDGEKVEYRKYDFLSFPKRYFIFFIQIVLHLHLFLMLLLKSISLMNKKNPSTLNKKYDNNKINFYLRKKFEIL